MHSLEIVLFLTLTLFLPVFEFFTHAKNKQHLLANPSMKIRSYKSTIVILWLPTLLLIYLLFNGVISKNDIRLLPIWNSKNLLSIGILLVLSAYCLYTLVQIKKDAETRKKVAKNFAGLAWFLPNNRQQWLWFILPLSITAGVCEELLFRGFLLSTIDNWLPLWAAVVLSSFVFGLLHIYQGLNNMLQVFFVGLVLAIITLFTGSLLIPIVIHILMDMYSGTMAYLALRDQETSNHLPTT